MIYPKYATTVAKNQRQDFFLFDIQKISTLKCNTVVKPQSSEKKEEEMNIAIVSHMHGYT